MHKTQRQKMASSTSKSSDPNFIKYLLNPSSDYDCYLVVGNPSLAPVEKIGVVKQMLFAYSSVMRSDLQVKDIKDKVPIEILDIFPSTFRDLLRYVYGFDTTATLSFDDADNLLYAAEKYMISCLKNKVATRLQSLLNNNNICILMNNPVCYQTLGLNSQINKILQYETRKVFDSPHFLDLTSDAFVKLLEQEMLNVKEIEVWRNAIKWAKHKAKRGNGKTLREELKKPLKQIRVCTIQMEDFCREVVPTKVLLDHEVTEVCLAHGSKRQANLIEVCNKVQIRALPIVKSESKSKTLSNHANYNNICNGSFTIHTSDLGIEISSITMRLMPGRRRTLIMNSRRNDIPVNESGTFKVSLGIERVGSTQDIHGACHSGTGPSTSVWGGNPETKLVITHTGTYQQGEITIPVSKDDQEVHLLPLTKYKINIDCDQLFAGFSYSNPSKPSMNIQSHYDPYYGSTYTCTSQKSDFTVCSEINTSGILVLPIKQIDYKTLTFLT